MQQLVSRRLGGLQQRDNPQGLSHLEEFHPGRHRRSVFRLRHRHEIAPLHGAVGRYLHLLGGRAVHIVALDHANSQGLPLGIREAAPAAGDTLEIDSRQGLAAGEGQGNAVGLGNGVGQGPVLIVDRHAAEGMARGLGLGLFAGDRQLARLGVLRVRDRLIGPQQLLQGWLGLLLGRLLGVIPLEQGQNGPDRRRHAGQQRQDQHHQENIQRIALEGSLPMFMIRHGSLS